jgi:hypothetical protein
MRATALLFSRTTAAVCPVPALSGIHRRGDSGVSNRDYILSCSKLAPCPEADIAIRCRPLNHDIGFQASITGIAAFDLELV